MKMEEMEEMVELVILAKSIKHRGYCVAGKCVAGKKMGNGFELYPTRKERN